MVGAEHTVVFHYAAAVGVDAAFPAAGVSVARERFELSDDFHRGHLVELRDVSGGDERVGSRVHGNERLRSAVASGGLVGESDGLDAEALKLDEHRRVVDVGVAVAFFGDDRALRAYRDRYLARDLYAALLLFHLRVQRRHDDAEEVDGLAVLGVEALEHRVRRELVGGNL